MKKYHFTYLALLYLIATSCENTVFEETALNTSTTRSTIESLGYFGTNFFDVETLETKNGVESMAGYLEAFPYGTEFHFSLGFGAQEEGVKAKVSVIGSTIYYNGQESTSIYSDPNKIKKFTIKLHSGYTKVILSLETSTTKFRDNRVWSRLVIDNRYYQDQYIPCKLVGQDDLIIQARYIGKDSSKNPDSGTLPYHWICKSCDFLNSTINTTCMNCGGSK